MEIWIPLISACIGGLIATIPVLMGIAVQIYIHGSEIRQKKTEAKIQLEEELIKDAVKDIEAALDKSLNATIVYREAFYEKESIEYQLKKGFLTQEEANKTKLELGQRGENLMDESSKLDSIALRQAYSLGKEIVVAYQRFLETTDEFAKTCSFPKNIEAFGEKYYDEKLFDKVVESAGNVQKLLRDKLISIRNS